MALMLGVSELPSYIKDVEHVLSSVLSTDSSLFEASKRVIKGGGKRLRPILVIAGALSSGEEFDEVVVNAAEAVELAHLSSLVHDDIMDEAGLRWNEPTINSAEGVGTALMVGDSLLNKAYAQASKVSAKAVYELATATDKMCDAQEQEYKDRYNPDRSIDSYKEVIRGKTALLMAAACKIGGLAAGLSEKQIKTLGNYGESFGMAFQLIDDVLNFTSTTELLGKPAGNDVEEGVYTLPLLLALQSSAGEQLRSWLGKEPQVSIKQAEMVQLLVNSGVIDKTLIEARRYNRQAADSLKAFDKNDVVKGLAQFPDAYMEWALKKQLR